MDRIKYITEESQIPSEVDDQTIMMFDMNDVDMGETIPIGGGSGGGSAVEIEDSLESEDTDKALSANQGKVLSDMIAETNGTLEGINNSITELTGIINDSCIRKEEAEQFFAEAIKQDLSDEVHIIIEKPTQVVKVNLIIENFPDTKDDNYTGELEFFDSMGHYFKKPISGIGAQGSMSYTIHFPKQSFKFDMSDCDIKFGDWPVLDSFHMKAWFIDGLRGKGIIIYRAMTDINDSMGYDKARPWRRLFNSTSYETGSGDEWNDFDTEGKGVPDAFPVALYLNGEFYGIYTWSIKKDRANYHMKKDNPLNIHIDSTDTNWETFMFNSTTTSRGNIKWNKASIRNPNSLKTTTQTTAYVDVTSSLNTTDPTGEGYVDPESMFKIASEDAGGYNPSEWTDEHITNVITPQGFNNDPYVWYITSKGKTKYFHYELSYTEYSKDYPSEILNDESIDPYTYQVRQSIQRLSDFYYDYYQVSKVNSTTSEAHMLNKKNKFEEYFDPDWMIDYMLLVNFVMLTDCMHRNTQWCTWDGLKWYPLMYDTDTAFGCHWSGPFIQNKVVTDNTDCSIVDFHVRGVNGYKDAAPWKQLWELYKSDIEARYAELVDLGFFTVDYYNEKITEWVRSIGYNYYKMEFKKWPSTIGYRDPLTNTEYWKWRGMNNRATDENGNYTFTKRTDITPYRPGTSYNVGDLVYMTDYPNNYQIDQCTIFECIKACTDQRPVTGSYDDVVNVERGNWGIGPDKKSSDDLESLRQRYSGLCYGGYYESVKRILTFLRERKAFLDRFFNYQNLDDIISDSGNDLKGE